MLSWIGKRGRVDWDLGIWNWGVLIENAMYRTLLARCGFEKMEMIYLYIRCMKLKILGATRCKQRAVHCICNENELRKPDSRFSCRESQLPPPAGNVTTARW